MAQKPLTDQLNPEVSKALLAPWLLMLSAGATPANQGEDEVVQMLRSLHGSGDEKSIVGPDGPRIESEKVGPDGPAEMSKRAPDIEKVGPDGPRVESAPGLNQMDNGSNNMPAATTPGEIADPEDDALAPGEAARAVGGPTITDKKTIIRPLGTFRIHSADDLRRLKSAKTRQELESIKQDILNRGAGTFTPAE